MSETVLVSVLCASDARTELIMSEIEIFQELLAAGLLLSDCSC